mmetsp:Transcript_17193/g.56962  ORF Transcript_17193/g.56962 Transcript_17193/m.56962 type:complete len:891 (-) Transcript_17193:657-3329(-)
MVPVTFRFGNQSIVLNALLDTAAEESFISTKAVRKFGLLVTDAEVRKRVIMADGTSRLSDMVFQTKLGVGSSFKSSGSFYMLDLPHADMILSWEWMRANKIVIDAGHPRVFAKWRSKMVELPLLICPTNKQFGAADASLCQVLSYTEAVRDLKQNDSEWYVVHLCNLLEMAQPTDGATSLEQKAAETIMEDYSDVIRDDIPSDVVLDRSFKATIRLKDNVEAVQKKPYPVPLALEEELKANLAFLLERGIIEPSTSEFTSPVIFTKKSDGTLRFCTDMRFVNSLIRNDNFPLPLVMELIERVGRKIMEERARYASEPGARLWISSLDLAKSFWQLELDAASRKYTCFITKFGKYQYRRIPFGLVDSANQFQKFLESVLQGLENCLSYIDDVCLISYGSLERHERLLRQALDRFRKEQLFVKKSKCKLFHSEIDFLGFHISEAGVSTQEKKVQAIVDRTAPQTVKELKSFLGVLNFYRKYVPDYAALALPLTNLLRKNVKFCWDDAQEAAFQELKKRLISAPVLRYFNPALATCVLVDASDYAIGAVLTQQHGEDLLPVAFFSKRLNSAEVNYSVREKELLGLISALVHFKFYLYGRRVLVRTDHKSLKYLLTQSNLTGRLFRWSQILADFDLDEISYIPGEENVIADYLSRPNDSTVVPSQSALDDEIRQRADLVNLDPTLLCTISSSGEGEVMEVTDSDAEVVTHCYALATDNAFTADVVKNYQQDRYFAQVLQDIQQGNLVPMQRRTYFLRDGVLFWKDSLGRERVCIPYHSRAKFLRLIHDDSCHVGKTKTFLKASQIAFWPTMSKDVANYVNSCAECLQGKSYKQRAAGEPHSHLVPRERFEKVSVDLLTALPTSKRGNDSVLVFLDQFSNRMILGCLRVNFALQS